MTHSPVVPVALGAHALCLPRSVGGPAPRHSGQWGASSKVRAQRPPSARPLSCSFWAQGLALGEPQVCSVDYPPGRPVWRGGEEAPASSHQCTVTWVKGPLPSRPPALLRDPESEAGLLTHPGGETRVVCRAGLWFGVICHAGGGASRSRLCIDLDRDCCILAVAFRLPASTASSKFGSSPQHPPHSAVTGEEDPQPS